MLSSASEAPKEVYKIFEEIEDRITNARYDDIKMLIRQLKSNWGDKLE